MTAQLGGLPRPATFSPSTSSSTESTVSSTGNSDASNTVATDSVSTPSTSPSQIVEAGSSTLVTAISTEASLNGDLTSASGSGLVGPVSLTGSLSDNPSNLPLAAGPSLDSTVTRPTSAMSSTASSLFSQSNKSSHGLSSKAAAGIGVGAAAAGAAIALFVAFIIFRCCSRRRNTQHLRHESSITLTGATQSQLFHPAYAPVPLAPVPLEKTDGAEMLTSSADDTLPASWTDLRDRIQSHVDSMYHSSRIEPGAVSLESFERLGYTRAQPSAPELLDRLMQPNYRLNALMYLVSWCIVQRIDFRGSRWTTLLPPECVESWKAMAGGAPAGNAQCRVTRVGDICDTD
jgi:hypothetical protein